MNFVIIKDDIEESVFLEGVNAAFKARSAKNIPYDVVTKEKKQDNSKLFGLYNDDNIMVAGFKLSNEIKNGENGVHLSQVWTHPNHQGNGYAKLLMKELDEYCKKNNFAFVSLGVSNIYTPAVSLYKNAGFKIYGVYANVPNTYYFLSMKKNIFSNHNELKRIIGYVISKLKFFVLFKKDSSPKLLHRIIYK